MTAAGVAKQVRYRLESTWDTLPGTSGAQLLRRTSSTLNLQRQVFENAEIASHFQRPDVRHGPQQVSGTIEGELSPLTYRDFIGASLRRDFTTVAAITGASITVAGTGPTWTLTRGAGSYLTDGVKIGQVIMLTAGAFNVANSNKNLIVIALTATVATVMPVNGVALVAEGPIASATVTIPGRVSFAPPSAHVNRSYTIEHWHADVSRSEVYTGCEFPGMRIGLPATGMATIGFDVIGRRMITASTAYYVTPAAETTTGTLAAVNGILIAQGVALARVTGLELRLAGGHATQPVVGTNLQPRPAPDRIVVSGSMTATFDDHAQLAWFTDETDVSLAVALATGPAGTADFVSIVVPRLKLTSADKDDPRGLISQTLAFEALYNSAGGAGVATEQTTLYVQDSRP